MTRIMYDSVSPATLPPGAELYAGYDDGNFNNTAAIRLKYPSATVVSVTVTPTYNNGTVLDVERGDARPTQAPAWVAMRRLAGADPTVYCSYSTWPAVRTAFLRANIPPPHYWIAGYPGIGPYLYQTSVAHQYESTPGYDISVVATYWPGVDLAPPAPSAPPPIERETMPYYCTNSKGTGFIVATDLSSKTGIPDANDAQTLLNTHNYQTITLSDALLNIIPT